MVRPQKKSPMIKFLALATSRIYRPLFSFFDLRLSSSVRKTGIALYTPHFTIVDLVHI